MPARRSVAALRTPRQRCRARVGATPPAHVTAAAAPARASRPRQTRRSRGWSHTLCHERRSEEQPVLALRPRSRRCAGLGVVRRSSRAPLLRLQPRLCRAGLRATPGPRTTCVHMQPSRACVPCLVSVVLTARVARWLSAMACPNGGSQRCPARRRAPLRSHTAVPRKKSRCSSRLSQGQRMKRAKSTGRTRP